MNRQVCIIEDIIENRCGHAQPKVHLLVLVEQPLLDGVLGGCSDVAGNLRVIELSDDLCYLLYPVFDGGHAYPSDAATKEGSLSASPELP